MSSSSPGKAPTAGQELSSALGALNGGAAGTLETDQAQIGGNLAQVNTGMNIQNVQSLSDSMFGPKGFDQMAQTQATNMGNAFLTNQVGQLNANEGQITGDMLSANPYAGQLNKVANSSSFLGAGLDSGMESLANMQADSGASINPMLSDISKTNSNSLATANTQLSLGSSVSPGEAEQISQASSAADSSRGIFNSNTSAFNASLAEGNYGQNLLTTREQAANTANTTAANTTATGLGAQIGAFQGASQTQNSALSQQAERQSMGIQTLGQLTSMGNQDALAASSFVTGQSGAYGANLGSSLFGSGMNTMMASQANPTSSFFNSMGLFGASQDSAMTQFNANFASNEQNAQASNSLLGAGVGAVGSVAGAATTAAANAGLFSSLGAGIAGLFSY